MRVHGQAGRGHLLALLVVAGCGGGAPGGKPPTAKPRHGDPQASRFEPEVVESATVYGHACVVRSGEVWCWGDNESRQLGVPGGGAWAFPLRVPGIANAVQVRAGLSHTCAVRADGTVVCWGGNTFGQLGNGTVEPWRGPTAVPGIADAVQVSAGADETCVLHRSGRVSCWGDTRCMLDVDRHCAPEHIAPRTIPGLSGVVQVEVAGCLSGDEHLGGYSLNYPFALDARGRVWGFGHNEEPRALDWSGPVARLGGGCWMSTILQDGSVQLAPSRYFESRAWKPHHESTTLRGMTRIAGHCGIVADRVRCWHIESERLVVDPPVDGTATELTVGTSCSCLRRPSGKLQCWGPNYHGACGVGATTWVTTPRRVAGLEDVAEIAVGGHASCARTRAGQVLCWGSTQVASGPTGYDRDAPQLNPKPQPVDVAHATAIAVGPNLGCAVVEGHGVTCWGAAGPDGKPRDRQGPAIVPGLGSATHLDIAWDRLCASGPDGMRCQGRYRAETGPALGATHGLDQVVVGRYFACHKSRFGPLACAGASFASTPPLKHLATDQYRLCGVGFPGVRCFRRPATERPARFEPDGEWAIPDATQLALGQDFTCVLLRDGTVQCWGTNDQGQLGRGHREPGEAPAPVVDLPSKVTQIAASTFHVCALTEAGTVYCWGGNTSAQVGLEPRVLEPRTPRFEAHPELDAHWRRMARADHQLLATDRARREADARGDVRDAQPSDDFDGNKGEGQQPPKTPSVSQPWGK